MNIYELKIMKKAKEKQVISNNSAINIVQYAKSYNFVTQLACINSHNLCIKVYKKEKKARKSSCLYLFIK